MFEHAARTRRAGSAGTTEAEARRPVRRALVVGAADDVHERAADRAADLAVARMDEARRPSLGRDQPGRVSRSAAAVAADVGPLDGVARRVGTDVQDHPRGRDGGTVDGALASRITAGAGGRALDAPLRRRVEDAFGADFRNVRIHTDRRVAADIGARAYTVGSDVHFAPGAFAPATRAGRHLLAHELAHTLQQGSGRVQRTMAVVQRDHKDTGMKKDDSVEAYAKKVRDRTTGAKNPLGSTKEWDKLDADARAKKIVKYVNAELKKASAPPVAYALDPAKTFAGAEFDFQSWTVSIGSRGLDGAMSDADVAELADTVYHECRHSEQWYRIARLKAGESPKPTVTDLARDLFIPASIAKRAHAAPIAPLTDVQKFFHTKKWAERQDTKLAEATSWYDSIYGANAANRGAILGDLANRNAEYMALAEEVDAWGVAGKAKSSVRDLLAKVRLKQQAATAATA